MPDSISANLADTTAGQLAWRTRIVAMGEALPERRA